MSFSAANEEMDDQIGNRISQVMTQNGQAYAHYFRLI